MINFAIIGSAGMVGSGICKFFLTQGISIIPISRTEFDILKDSLLTLEKLLSKTEVIINCTGILASRMTETSLENLFQVNTLFPKNLSILCQRLNKKCFHISSDAVFNGARGHYTELDTLDMQDWYSLSKAAGEACGCMILRTSLIGEEQGRTRSLLEWARTKAGQSIQGYLNHRWNGMTHLELAQAILTIVTQDLYREGVFHLYSPHDLSKFELLTLINDVYELKMEIIPVHAQKSCNRILSSIYPLSKKIGIHELYDQITAMHQFFKHTK